MDVTKLSSGCFPHLYLKFEMTLNVEDLKKKFFTILHKITSELFVHLCHNPMFNFLNFFIFNSLRIKNMFEKFRQAQVLLQQKNIFNH